MSHGRAAAVFTFGQGFAGEGMVASALVAA